MKLKEVPGYFFRALQLNITPVRELTESKRVLNDVIISLTSIEARLATLHLVIRSLLSQTILAERIILWLNIDLKGDLPPALVALVSTRFEIRFSNEHSPHRKLVEPLRTAEFTSSIIITCDDDMMYPRDWLERLINAHQAYPADIVAHECRKILKNESGDILPYTKWIKETPGESESDTISIGYGGVLYPSQCLPEHTTNKKEYMRLAPRADDLWFKAMSFKNNTAIRRTQKCEPMPTPILGSQKVALKRANIKEDENRIQWLAIANELDIRL